VNPGEAKSRRMSEDGGTSRRSTGGGRGTDPSSRQEEVQGAADEAESRRIAVRLYARDPDAFEELYERFFSSIYGYVRSLLDRSTDAEDITHQVFEHTLRAVDSDELRDVRSLRQWLFAVARHRALDFQRAHGRVDLNTPGQLSERLTNVSGPPESGWTFDDPALAAALRRLPRFQREVVLLRYVEDFDLAEIAATIGSTESSVQNAHSRALRSLREALD
jgi:RNA polymerase sigma-70 factor (ECF subfamily)